MITVGVDLSAEPKNTGVARIEWTARGAVVRDLLLGADDDDVVDAVRACERAGIDSPFGWPEEFIDFVNAHRDSNLAVPEGVSGKDWRRELVYRVTDLEVRERTGLIPLSVSADRIAHPAMRCAGVLSRLADGSQPVDRAGSGIAIEVYPAASLHIWGLPHRGYKRDPAKTSLLVDELSQLAPWLDLGDFEGVCRASDDALDAVIAGLTARAAAIGAVTVPSAVVVPIAQREGWICLPTVKLEELPRTR